MGTYVTKELMPLHDTGRRRRLIPFVAAFLLCSRTAWAVMCPAPISLGPSPDRLLIVVPGTGQGPDNWSSFLTALRKDPQSANVAWLVFDHGIRPTSLGNARNVALTLTSCVDEKTRSGSYSSVTLIGHSIGGMIVRRAYLEASGVFPDTVPAPNSWASKVDRILLFASVNKGVPPSAKWWGVPASWLVRTFPHPQFVAEDLVRGSDFIADVRIAWIRHFGRLNAPDSASAPPRVVPFWGTSDSVVTERDNADLEAFSGPVVERVPGATHGDLPLLDEAHAPDPAARWALFRQHLFDERPAARVTPPAATRVLFIVRGIRDSSNSEWVSDLRAQAQTVYGAANVIDIEYGFFSAAHFAFRPLRSKTIPRFRDLYAERLAKEPLTTFDFIGHSNGTYILGESLMSTPSMRFQNVALAAPVLPTDFDWNTLFRRRQVQNVRYDTARWDWPVGILCPVLRALGFSDVGPSGVVLFGEGGMQDGRVKKVGWYAGGHGDSINPANRRHLLTFAQTGEDLTAGTATISELGAMQTLSRSTPYIVWLVLAGTVVLTVLRVRRGWRPSPRTVALVLASGFLFYVLLDVV